jgi:hypothetical protein
MVGGSLVNVDASSVLAPKTRAHVDRCFPRGYFDRRSVIVPAPPLLMMMLSL